MISDDSEIVRAVGEAKLGRYRNRATRQMERPGAGNCKSGKQREDQALFYLAWRSNFAASGFLRCAA